MKNYAKYALNDVLLIFYGCFLVENIDENPIKFLPLCETMLGKEYGQ